MKVVELPLGVTEDRLVGALDIEHALKKAKSGSSRASSPRPTGISSMWTK